MKTNEKNITKRILIPLSLTLLVLLTISIASIYWLQRVHLNEEIRKNLVEVEQLFQMKLDEDAKVLESQINLLQLDQDLQNAYRSKDRETLLHHAMPFFNAIRTKHQVTHFYFIDVEEVCFLRVHNPPRYGDTIPRFTLADAMRQDAPVYGIELGKFGTFTLRLVYPWRINGKLVGYLELGKEIEHITKALHKIWGVELFFTIHKSFITRAHWEEGLKMMERSGNWTQFPNAVIIDKTMPAVPQALKESLEVFSSRPGDKRPTILFKVSVDDKQYRGGFIPLFDAGNRELGEIVVLNNVSEQETALQTLSVVLIMLSVVIGGVLLGAFYFFIGGIEAKFIKVHDDLIIAEKLKNKLANEAKDEALRINQALDNVNTSVLIADTHSTIIYANQSAQQLLQQAETAIRFDEPHFQANNLLGLSIDRLLKKSGYQRELLEDITTTYHTQMTLGNLKLDMNITPVINAEGQRLGLVTEFHDRTAEIATEQEVNAVVSAASNGDFSQHIDLTHKTGFFNTFSEGLNQTLDNTQQMIEELRQVFVAIANGDLTKTMSHAYVGTLEQLKDDVNTTVMVLTRMINTVKQTVEVVNQAAEDISQGNTDLSQRTEQQAASLEETAASLEEITGTVQHNADNAQQANQLATRTREHAEQGGEVVGAAITAMTKISKSSKKVADIIGVIDEIAFQTNLLALNAAVEAARAGEQGRGFAVVATEVRNLAQRSAAAAKEIKGLIQDSVSKVEEGTRLVNQSGTTLEEIVVAVKKVSDIISEIAAASREQTAGIQQVNKVLAQLDQMTQQNAALVEEAATASATMKEQVQTLKEQVAFFNTGKGTMPSAVNSKKNVAASTLWFEEPTNPFAKSTPKQRVSADDNEGWEDF